MISHELATVSQQYHARIEALLSPEERAIYAAYEQRLLDTPPGATPHRVFPQEQQVLDKITGDTEAAALHKQLMVLLRVEKIPQ